MTYDLDLFESLNEEYAASRLVAQPIQRDTASNREKAARQVERIVQAVPIADKVVLDLGCGHGWLTAMLPNEGGAARAIGVDVRRYEAWDQHDSPDVELHVADLASDPVLEPESVDVVVSWSVLEHVHRPLEMLASIARLLKPDGKAWLYFNLHRGPKASHRYNEVFFPWPHLLFEDDVCKAFYRKHHDATRGFAWVNAMTLAHYLAAWEELGLTVTFLRRHTTPIDVPFYLRFADRLGQFPALDLETDFATVVIDKQAASSESVASIDYVERQRALDEAIAGDGRA